MVHYWHLHRGVAGVGRAKRATGFTPDFASCGQARIPGLRTTSTRRTMALADSGASGLAPLLDGITAGELIPELARQVLHRLAL